MNYYYEKEKRSMEQVKCWLYAMVVCVILAVIWGIYDYVSKPM